MQFAVRGSRLSHDGLSQIDAVSLLVNVRGYVLTLYVVDQPRIANREPHTFPQ